MQTTADAVIGDNKMLLSLQVSYLRIRILLLLEHNCQNHNATIDVGIYFRPADYFACLLKLFGGS